MPPPIPCPSLQRLALRPAAAYMYRAYDRHVHYCTAPECSHVRECITSDDVRLCLSPVEIALAFHARINRQLVGDATQHETSGDEQDENHEDDDDAPNARTSGTDPRTTKRRHSAETESGSRTKVLRRDNLTNVQHEVTSGVIQHTEEGSSSMNMQEMAYDMDQKILQIMEECPGLTHEEIALSLQLQQSFASKTEMQQLIDIKERLRRAVNLYINEIETHQAEGHGPKPALPHDSEDVPPPYSTLPDLVVASSTCMYPRDEGLPARMMSLLKAPIIHPGIQYEDSQNNNLQQHPSSGPSLDQPGCSQQASCSSGRQCDPALPPGDGPPGHSARGDPIWYPPRNGDPNGGPAGNCDPPENGASENGLHSSDAEPADCDEFSGQASGQRGLPRNIRSINHSPNKPILFLHRGPRVSHLNITPVSAIPKITRHHLILPSSAPTRPWKCEVMQQLREYMDQLLCWNPRGRERLYKFTTTYECNKLKNQTLQLRYLKGCYVASRLLFASGFQEARVQLLAGLDQQTLSDLRPALSQMKRLELKLETLPYYYLPTNGLMYNVSHTMMYAANLTTLRIISRRACINRLLLTIAHECVHLRDLDISESRFSYKGIERMCFFGENNEPTPLAKSLEVLKLNSLIPPFCLGGKFNLQSYTVCGILRAMSNLKSIYPYPHTSEALALMYPMENMAALNHTTALTSFSDSDTKERNAQLVVTVCPEVTKLHLSRVFNEDIIATFAQMKNVVHLIMEDFEAAVMTYVLAPGRPSLSVIELLNGQITCDMHSFISWLPDLDELHFYEVIIQDNPYMVHTNPNVSSGSGKGKSIVGQNVKRKGKNSYAGSEKKLCKNVTMERLRVLVLINCEFSSSTDFLMVLDACPNLEDLTARDNCGSFSVDDEDIRLLYHGGGPRQLRKITLVGVKLTMDSVEIFLSCCPHLRMLGNLRRWYDISEEMCDFYNSSLQSANQIAVLQWR